jgi:hypothetical protein
MQRQAPVPLREFAPVMLFMTAVTLAFISQIQALMVAGAGLCVLYAYAARSGRGLSLNGWLRLAICCLLFLPGFAKLYHGLSPAFYFLSTVATFFAAMAATRQPPAVLLAAFRWMYWAAVAAIAWVLFTYWGYPEPLGMVIEGTSTNGIPAYLIVIQVSLSLATYLVHGRLPVLSTLFTFAVAFFGNGRGSLVVAAFIVAATVTLNAFVVGRDKPHWRLAFRLALMVVALYIVTWGLELLELVTNHTKLSVGLVDTNRLEIWDQYSRNIDGFSFLFGADYSGTVIEDEYLGNPHIAYIRTHSLFGLPLTLLALLSPGFVLLARKALADKVVFFVFIGVAALRALSEPVFFPTLLDFFYFSWFLMYLKRARPSRALPVTSHPGFPRDAASYRPSFEKNAGLTVEPEPRA